MRINFVVGALVQGEHASIDIYIDLDRMHHRIHGEQNAVCVAVQSADA